MQYVHYVAPEKFLELESFENIWEPSRMYLELKINLTKLLL